MSGLNNINNKDFRVSPAIDRHKWRIFIFAVESPESTGKWIATSEVYLVADPPGSDYIAYVPRLGEYDSVEAAWHGATEIMMQKLERGELPFS